MKQKNEKEPRSPKQYCHKCGSVMKREYVDMHYDIDTGRQMFNIVLRQLIEDILASDPTAGFQMSNDTKIYITDRFMELVMDEVWRAKEYGYEEAIKDIEAQGLENIKSQ